MILLCKISFCNDVEKLVGCVNICRKKCENEIRRQYSFQHTSELNFLNVSFSSNCFERLASIHTEAYRSEYILQPGLTKNKIFQIRSSEILKNYASS
jgi:hypothetical protein